MAIIKPFAALRPRPELAGRICELPYDVMSSEEARQIADGNPLSFLHVSKPEIDLDPGIDPYSPAVYARGRENFQDLISQGALKQDAHPCFYLYRQVLGSHSQVGLVAVASCEEYLSGVIKKHELTRPDKEDDRVRHIETLNAQTGPVFLTYRAQPEIDALVSRVTAGPPAIDFTAPDGVRHTSWVIGEQPAIDFLEATFSAILNLYIADGHHRSAAAARVFRSRKGAGHSAWFLAVIFPHNQLQILPYNRVLLDLNGLSPAELLRRLGEVGTVTPADSPALSGRHEVAVYLEKRWRHLRFDPRAASSGNPIDRLDVSILQRHVLQPVFGIDDPRTSKRIQFVGGIRGTAELERLVDSGQFACAFAMYPTSIDDLLCVADANEIMPPKSTWFEPKLRDAMFCHLI